MKFVSLLLFTIMLFACSGNGPANPSISDTVVTAQMTPPTTIHDTILWIGKSARWKKTPVEIYDGSYDSLSSFFIPCGKSNTIKVPRVSIEFDLVSNCDTSFGSRVRLLDLKRGDSTPVILPHQIVMEPGNLSGKASVQFNQGTETIVLKAQEAARVQQAAAARKYLYVHKQAMSHQ